MDEITRAVELTKARILELNGAFLQVLCHTRDAPRTYEDLRAHVERTGREWTQDCKEIRDQVKKDEAVAPADGTDEKPELGDLLRKQVRTIKDAFNQRLKTALGGLVNPEEAEAVASAMDDLFDDSTGPFLRDMLGTMVRFDLKIKEIDEKLKELNALDDGEEWKRR